jgi:hypothetical protein
MGGRRAWVAVAGAAVVLVAIVWVLSMAYPSLWCSILGSCNQ